MSDETADGNKFAFTIDERVLSYHLGDNHPMNSSRVFPAYHLIKQLFLNSDVIEGFEIVVPDKFDKQLLYKAHSRDYIETFEKLSEEGTGMALEFGLGRGDCPIIKDVAKVSEFVASSTVVSVEKVFSSDFSIIFSMMGGLHHASRSKASGFCYYNDINIAIHRLKELDNNIKILYIDTDVHHGDGTQFDFYNDPNVLTISFHESGRYIFPGTGFSDEIGENDGLGYSINLPFMPYTTDDIYLEQFKRIVPSIFESYNPDFVIWQAGVDAHKDDVLGHMQLTTNSYHKMATIIRELAIKNMNTPRVVVLGGGGYNPYSVAKSWINTISGLSKIKIPDNADQSWVDLCKLEGIEVDINLKDNKTIFDCNMQDGDNIYLANQEYFEEFQRYIGNFYSL